MDRREFLGCMGCASIATAAGCVALRPRSERDGSKAMNETSVKPEDFAYCGADCNSCDVRRASVGGDQEARMRAAKVWAKTAKEHWGMEILDPMILDCAGCRVEGYVQHKGYGRCPMRPCAKKRGLASCGLCPDWRQCKRLEDVFADEPEARRNLERVAQAARV